LRFAEEAPECVGGVGDAFGGFHDYAFIFGFDDELVADFYSEFFADLLGDGYLAISSNSYVQLNHSTS
jgi:hypothetical protein